MRPCPSQTAPPAAALGSCSPRQALGLATSPAQLRAAGASAADGSADAYGAAVTTPGLEWLRQLLDDGSVTDLLACRRTEVQGVAAAASARPSALVRGPQQLSPRLWRHLHHLHVEAAAAAPGGGWRQGVYRLYDRDAVLEAACHRTVLALSAPGRVAELAAARGAGSLGPAAQVLANFLADAGSCVEGLARARVLPAAWTFSTARMAALLRRVEAAAMVAAGGGAGVVAGAAAVTAVGASPGPAWTASDLMQRLMFEVRSLKGARA